MTQIFYNISRALTLASAAAKDGRKINEKDLSIIDNAIMVVKSGRIKWIGPKKDFKGLRGKKINLHGAEIMPSLTECHTHLVFAGDRADDFERRNNGESYESIARGGGGILSTVQKTRSIKESDLKKISQARVDNFIKQGVTTLEIKSGYGLSLESEIKLLKVIKSLKGPEIISTFMGAHSLPQEFKNSEEYIDEVLSWIPKIKKYATRADIFVEKGFFNLQLAKKYLEACKASGLSTCGHTDQLSAGGSSCELVKMGVKSVEHAIHLSTDDILKLSQSDATVVLLPLSDFYLNISYPKARELIDQGARVALATDFNPGTAPSQDTSLVGVLARLKMKMSLPEVICAYTYGASMALGKGGTQGSLEVGKNANFLVLSDSWKILFYQAGFQPIAETWKSGKLLKS